MTTIQDYKSSTSNLREELKFVHICGYWGGGGGLNNQV